MTPERATVTCPKCFRPVSLIVSVRVMADGEVTADYDGARRGMVIHVTKGCVAKT